VADSDLEQSTELTVSEAAAAIENLLKQPPAPEAQEEQTPEQPHSPQAAEAEAGNTEVEQPGAVTSETPAPEAEPAKPVPVQTSSPELDALRQEATRKVQEAETARNQYVNQLNTLIPQLEASIKGEFADIKSKEDLYALADPRSPNYNVERYNAAIIAFSKLNDAMTARQTVVQEQQKQRDEQMTQWRQAEQEKVSKLIPELADQVKGPVLAKKLQDFAVKQGYTPQQLSMASASDFAMLHKAMQFEDLTAAQAAARQKAASAPPVQKPGVTRPNTGKEEKLQSDYERLQRTGNVNDAASVFRHFIN
jgi:Predicted membrane protein